MKKIPAELVKVRVQQLANKNQFVIWFKNGERDICAFQSYNTLIAYFMLGSYELKECDELYINWSMWDYSKTTLKHLKMFVNEYTPYHYDNKQQFLNEMLKGEVGIFEE